MPSTADISSKAGVTRLEFQRTLERMRNLVRELECSIHAGRSSERIWVDLRECNDVLSFVVRSEEQQRERAQRGKPKIKKYEAPAGQR